MKFFLQRIQIKNNKKNLFFFLGGGGGGGRVGGEGARVSDFFY